MMSRASRMLKWVGAVTILLAAAPIAYAEPAPLPASDPAATSSTRCGDGPGDDAGAHTIPGPTNMAYRLGLPSMRVTQPSSEVLDPLGTWAGANSSRYR